jgi:hypothetical protein
MSSHRDASSGRARCKSAGSWASSFRCTCASQDQVPRLTLEEEPRARGRILVGFAFLVLLGAYGEECCDEVAREAWRDDVESSQWPILGEGTGLCCFMLITILACNCLFLLFSYCIVRSEDDHDCPAMFSACKQRPNPYLENPQHVVASSGLHTSKLSPNPHNPRMPPLAYPLSHPIPSIIVLETLSILTIALESVSADLPRLKCSPHPLISASAHHFNSSRLRNFHTHPNESALSTPHASDSHGTRLYRRNVCADPQTS